MRVMRRFKVVFSKSQQQKFINQVNNWKKALIIEIVDNIDRLLALFVIIKKKK